MQERKEVLNLLRVFLCGYIRAESPHQISVIHKFSERGLSHARRSSGIREIPDDIYCGADENNGPA
jgi:hypothetical protein